MKRSLSESDGEDVFDDDLKNGSPSQSCQITDRKKRRGVIEKRRRDRINSSLSELRRLVPTAFEKQGSAKLEKAEILQMTVDHLKMLHQKGINGYNYQETHTVAMDYRTIGFRECASEVARYLVAVEGMDLQDPLRLRLLGHLQCFSSQRDVAVATKTTNLHNSAWNSMQTHPSIGSQYCAGGISSVGNMFAAQHTGQSEHMSMTSHSAHSGVSTVSFSEPNRLNTTDNTPSLHNHPRLGNSTSLAGHSQITMNSQNGQQVSPSLMPSIPQLSSQYPVTLPVNSMMSPNGTHSYHNAVKPYRPWGGEIAY